MNRGGPGHRACHARQGVHPAVVMLDGTAHLPREILGNKGFGIDAMRRHGLSVPPAFCITTPVCDQYFAEPDSTLDAIWADVLALLSRLEVETSRTFGRGPRPLLVSVRSGSAHSMPGMLDTVLDLGMDDAVESALGAACTPEFARDTRTRFRQMYRRIVLGANDITATTPVPDDPHVQLRAAIEAVFASWNSPRALSAVRVRRPRQCPNCRGRSRGAVDVWRDLATSD
jgi:pyruvate, orthophosphate dikinase